MFGFLHNIVFPLLREKARRGHLIPRGVTMHLVLVLLCLFNARAQSARSDSDAFASRFTHLFISEPDSLFSMVDPEEYRLSSRLGIQYEGVRNKFLIGFDLDDQTRQRLRNGALTCQSEPETLQDEYSRVRVETADGSVSRSFYFNQRGRLVSPVEYFSRHWSRKESPYFSFRISDPTLFHQEAIEQLDSFVERMSHALSYSDTDMRLLAKEKIIYVLCRDENEIEQLTGFRSRGMYLLAYDYITTTYSCHFHELVHLLVNFKLRRLPLYTHPLLQEGLAVAYGGRGGIAAPSLQQSAVFLCQTGSLGFGDLLSPQGFAAVDPSLTYPVSGLYIRFLIDRLGMQRFLEVYRKYSGDNQYVRSTKIDTSELPPESQWQAYMVNAATENTIQLSALQASGGLILADSAIEIQDAGRFYHVRMKPLVGLMAANPDPTYRSKRFMEACPGRTYRGERYLFVGDPSEVTIYDLYTNNSIAGFVSGFSTTMEKVRQERGMMEMWVLKDVFSEQLIKMKAVSYGN